MITDISYDELDAISGGWGEGAAASAELLAIGFGALALVPSPASPFLGTASIVIAVIGVGIGYIGATTTADGGTPPMTGKEAAQKTQPK